MGGLEIVGLAYAGWFFVGSIVIKFTHRHRVYSDDKFLAPEELPATARSYFDSMAPALAAEGFRVSGYLSQKGAVALVEAFIAVWVNRERGQSANLYVVVPAVGPARRSAEFETICGKSFNTIVTNNDDRDVGVMAPVPWRHAAYLRWAKDVRELYEIHLYRERELLHDTVRFIASDQQLLTGSKAHSLLFMRHQVRSGLMYETTVDGVFGLTWQGAFLMVLRVIPPLKQLRIWLKRLTRKREYLRALKHIPVARPTEVVLTEQSPFEQELSGTSLSYQ